MLILILNEYTKSSDKNLSDLSKLFAHDFFTVKICKSDKQPETGIDIDTFYTQKALKYWSTSKFKDDRCLIIKDNSICNLNTDQLINNIKKLKKADLYYLSVYNDQCDKYTPVLTGTDTGTGTRTGTGTSTYRGSDVVYTKNPNSTQAIIYEPKTRDFLLENINDKTVLQTYLNDLLIKNKLTALTFFPNIIHFDISLATSKNDYIKNNQCMAVTNDTNNDPNTTMILWIIIVLVLVLLLAWSVFQLGPRHQTTGKIDLF
jgi:hypothetical protein